jgi:putative ABC transport system substrate-binding protein
MHRRAFIAVIATALATRAVAQQPQGPRRIGILNGGRIPPTGMADEMAKFGWVEGRNLVIERRSAEGDAQRAKDLAAELVRLNVDVIMTFGAVASLAARDATRTIPIVANTGDPVLLGLVPNFSHPGGNVTGTTQFAPELATKRLEILRTMLPDVVRIAELVDPANEYIKRARSEYEHAFRALGMQPVFVELPAPSELNRAFADIERQRAQALVIRGDPMFFINREQIIRLARQIKLPTIAEGRRYAEAGALASYAPKQSATLLRMAALIDKILRGAKPGDLPIEQATEFELVVNLGTAKALGITIPPSLLQRADELIQ